MFLMPPWPKFVNGYDDDVFNIKGIHSKLDQGSNHERGILLGNSLTF
jgi:hypothetical protein